MRRRSPGKRKMLPDRKYKDVLIEKLINLVMQSGKKSIAETICYNALERGAESCSTDVVTFFHKVIDNVQPPKKIILRRFGGSTYSVPKEVRAENRPPMAIRIIAKSFRALAWDKGQKATEALREVLSQSYNGSGPAIKAKEDLAKVVAQNAAFAHFQW